MKGTSKSINTSSFQWDNDKLEIKEFGTAEFVEFVSYEMLIGEEGKRVREQKDVCQSHRQQKRLIQHNWEMMSTFKMC